MSPFLISSLLGFATGAIYSQIRKRPEPKSQVRQPTIVVFSRHRLPDGSEVFHTSRGSYFRRNGKVRGPFPKPRLKRK